MIGITNLNKNNFKDWLIDHPEINTIVNKSKGIFDVRGINTGNSYTVICAPDSTEKAQYFVYEIALINVDFIVQGVAK